MDLNTFLLQGDILTESSWVFVAKWPVHQETRATVEKILRGVFLVSCQQEPPLTLSTPLVVSRFEEMSRFFRAIADGKGSAATMQRAYRHLIDLDKLQRVERFTRERNAFADQFRHDSPRMGLNGFLNKNPTPFLEANRGIESLKILADWLGESARHPL